ncbi:enoyl-CoA hydratase [Ornithinibacillus sp. BX22]|uniref:Enoyl-CoA hydratase n=2 Tax=Ornithinibacillus TaxID=484508 RepID=A0A923RGN1_9BACI|nr:MULTISPECIES: enoyl-CoA hydratase [Ornithinibacillus]MBC5636081.1 enoyl-CoA hydratase [Ornithinibacillus hominis]MBS3679911.1 enoyl-CoA hydratase [Ornithinibacillus massiliensis]
MTLVELEIVNSHVAVITLNRPQAANAMSKALLDELNQVIQKVNHDPNIYCAVLTGAGVKAFCAGADLKERRGMADDQVIAAVRNIGKTVSEVEAMKVPVIAALNGIAFGGGLELALCCDIRIAADHVKLGLTETSLAIIPGAGGTQRLPRLIGIGRAKQLIYTAKPITAQEAFSIGLVEQVVSNEELHDVAIQMALDIAKNGPIALRQAKTAINQGSQVNLATALEIEHLCYKETIPTNDRLEGLEAFREKRSPVYQGN